MKKNNYNKNCSHRVECYQKKWKMCIYCIFNPMSRLERQSNFVHKKFKDDQNDITKTEK